MSTNIKLSASKKIPTNPGGWGDLWWNVIHQQDDGPYRGQHPLLGKFEYFNWDLFLRLLTTIMIEFCE